MDFLTHLLAGALVNQRISSNPRKTLAISLVASVFPDMGELIIQQKLSDKYNAAFGVYDSRTSDVMIANDLSTTLLYDLTHSLTLTAILFFTYLCVRKNWVLIVTLSQLSHVLLDCFTHGKVWPLKLFYPLSNNRYPLLSEHVGNWWDWHPKISIHLFDLPIHCLFIWLLLSLTIIQGRKKKSILSMVNNEIDMKNIDHS